MNTVDLIACMKLMFIFTTYIDIEYIYWECRGSISKFLNSSLHESLGLELVMILITLFFLI